MFLKRMIFFLVSLNDGDAAVTEEWKSYNEIEERHSAVDEEECDEEAETS